MAKYKVKPTVSTVIEAEQFDIKAFCDDKGRIEDAKLAAKGIKRQAVVIDGHNEVKLSVQGPDGPLYFGDGDWLVTEKDGSRYPIDSAKFAATYDPVGGSKE